MPQCYCAQQSGVARCRRSITLDSDLLRASASLLTSQYSQLLSQNYILKAQTTATWKQLMAAIQQTLMDGEKKVIGNSPTSTVIAPAHSTRHH